MSNSPQSRPSFQPDLQAGADLQTGETPDQSLPATLGGLNPNQQKAVAHFKGPILVLAGAGSGKTRVLTRRIAHLILTHGVRPQNIIAVTFTNKATEEMRARLSAMLGERAENLWVATFHSAALRILRRNASHLGYQSDFVVYDDQDTKGVLKQVLKDCNIDEKKYSIQGFARAIDQAKNSVILPEDYLKWASGSVKSLAQGNSWGDSPRGDNFIVKLQAEVYSFYQKALLRANAMDFGDLVMNAVLLFEGIPEVLSFYQHHIHFTLVDEFQDTNEAQYRFIRLLTKANRNLLVVGDDDQSIYAFRGATIRNILEFEKDYPDTKVVTLDQNYRSTGNILEAAYGVIRHNSDRKEKHLWTSAPKGDLLRLFVGADEMEEARFVAQEVKRFKEAGGTLDQIAVFYRTNAQSRVLEEAFLAAKIPYRIFGGLKFYDRKEIKDILAYLRLFVNPVDDQAFLRTINTPPRGIGATAVQSIQRLASENQISLLAAARLIAAKNKSVRAYIELVDELTARSNSILLSALIHEVVNKTGYGPKLREMHDATAESRIENLLELEAIGRAADTLAGTPAETLRMFLDRVSLTSSADILNEDGSEAGPVKTVSFMTLHLAKGLEFPLVFLTGVEEGLLPHYRSIYDETQLEEERRLCYVGITRAMQQLYLTRALSRGMFASGGDSMGGLYREPSRFLSDIPHALTEQSGLEYDPSDDVWNQDRDNW
jgi:DNA helicase-2/ATP-dependent DNA helicase PcrA